MRAVRRGALAPVMVAALTGVAAVAAAGPAMARPAAASPAPSSAAADGPAGSNGTVKIDEIPVDGGMDTDAHVGCAFTVRFFGFDGGAETGRLVFSGKPPTGGGTLLDTTASWTAPARTSGTTLDHEQPVDLSRPIAAAGLTPATQGFHVGLTVEVTEPDGRVVTKHKVFWVGPCDSSAATAAGAATSAPSGEGDSTAASTAVATGAQAPAAPPAATVGAADLAASGSSTGATVAAMGLPTGVSTGLVADVSGADLAAAQSSGGSALREAGSGGGILAGPRVLAADLSRLAALPFTGVSTWVHVVEALLLIATGALLLLLARRPQVA